MLRNIITEGILGLCTSLSHVLRKSLFVVKSFAAQVAAVNKVASVFA